MHVLLLDNYDSFTYNLYDYLLQTGVQCTVVRNDAVPESWMHTFPFDALVLSPGPKRPADAGQMMDLIQQVHQHVPILGICLGHQALGEFFGAHLVKAREPMHGKTSTVWHNGHPAFQDIPTPFEVMRYHSLVLQPGSTSAFELVAETSEGEIMAMEHKELPLFGVQYHPESILSEYGLQFIRNWLSLNRTKKKHHVDV
ncbi:MAG: aminodeoxychorismate/anthranilate synthase component II [Saprospiraceae bacterium]|jgi:anthranilate synthase/aminodeoxychorismate synthase-like glutamine amidotransferase